MELNPLVVVGIIVGIIGYLFMQVSNGIALFVATALVSLAGLIAAIVYSDGFLRYFLIGMTGIVVVYFIKRLLASRV